MRATRNTLFAIIRRIVRIIKYPLTLNSQSNMPGTRYSVDSYKGRKISDTLKPSEMEAWLQGYEAALNQLQLEAEEEHRLQIGMRVTSFPDDKDNPPCAAPVIGCLFCPCPDCRKTVRDREASRRKTMEGFLPE